MIWTDRDFLYQADLNLIDGSLPKVVAADNKGGGTITVDGPSGIIDQSIAECGQKLLSQMRSFGILAPIGVSDLHVAAVMNNVWIAGQTPRARLGQVVVDSLYGNTNSELKNWVMYYALCRIYENAYARAIEDRYAKKLELYTKREREMWLQLMRLGCACVFVPFPCPGAFHEPGSGIWNSSNLSSVSGGSGAEPQSVQVAITYVDTNVWQGPNNPLQSESGPSDILNFTIPANQLLSVNISTLMPPDGPLNVGYSQGIWQRRTANAWNVYVGAGSANTPAWNTLSQLYLQNPEPIPISFDADGNVTGTTSYALPGAPVLSGALLSKGQNADTRVVFQNIMNRG